MSDKPINWVGSSREDLRSFSAFARTKAGFQLRAVKKGQVPSNSGPMPTIGKGVKEIRIRANGAYGVFYVARFSEKDCERGYRSGSATLSTNESI